MAPRNVAVVRGKKRMLSMETKLEIIKKYEDGIRLSVIARKYGRNTSTISTIVKMKDAIKAARPSKGVTILSSKRSQFHDEMERRLLVWIKEKKIAGDKIIDTAVCLKASAIFDHLVHDAGEGTSWHAPPKFKASRGWLEKFKKRTGIHPAEVQPASSRDKSTSGTLIGQSHAGSKSHALLECPWIKEESETYPTFRIGFIGAGNMAFGIVKGILSGNVLPTNVKVSAPSQRNLGRFQELNISTTHSNTDVASSSDVIFVAVKPHLVPTILSEISQHITDRHIIVSVAAGVTLATLEELLPPGSRVIRLMPNLPCVVLQGALLFARGTHAKQEHGALLHSLLHCCGLVEEGPEAWIDIHTGLSGSGVAFVYLFAEALAEGAVKMGMPSALAHRIASQTVLGAGHLLRDSNKHPAQLRSEVCTPGGTTIYGLHALEQGGVRASTMTAVESATERARELGRKSAALESMK
nr:pyrroline-5-carboxylate reductase 3-like [Nerophis lumbriciformis]